MFGKARYTVRSFSIRRNEKISTSVTVRGEKAMSLIVSVVGCRCRAGGGTGPGVEAPTRGWGERASARTRMRQRTHTQALLPLPPSLTPSPFFFVRQESGLKVKEYELLRRNFSETGNFGFGISEHIDLGIKYDPSTGIYGASPRVLLVVWGRRAGWEQRGGARNRHGKGEMRSSPLPCRCVCAPRLAAPCLCLAGPARAEGKDAPD